MWLGRGGGVSPGAFGGAVFELQENLVSPFIWGGTEFATPFEYVVVPESGECLYDGDVFSVPAHDAQVRGPLLPHMPPRLSPAQL